MNAKNIVASMDTVWTNWEKESADAHKHSLAYQYPMLEITSDDYIISFDYMVSISLECLQQFI
mgnify:CR=1 FL=1